MENIQSCYFANISAHLEFLSGDHKRTTGICVLDSAANYRHKTCQLWRQRCRVWVCALGEVWHFGDCSLLCMHE